MQRRSALVSLGAMILGARVSVAARSGTHAPDMRVSIGDAAVRVARHAGNLPQFRSAVCLCRLVADRCESGQFVAPALVQSTLDAIVRGRAQGPVLQEFGGFSEATADFELAAVSVMRGAAV